MKLFSLSRVVREAFLPWLANAKKRDLVKKTLQKLNIRRARQSHSDHKRYLKTRAEDLLGGGTDFMRVSPKWVICRLSEKEQSFQKLCAILFLFSHLISSDKADIFAGDNNLAAVWIKENTEWQANSGAFVHCRVMSILENCSACFKIAERKRQENWRCICIFSFVCCEKLSRQKYCLNVLWFGHAMPEEMWIP